MNDLSEPLTAWERRVFERLAKDAFTEHRSARRWRIFFKLLWFGAIFWMLLLTSPTEWFTNIKESRSHTAVVSIKGIIMEAAEASAENIIPALQHAFEDKSAKGIILQINSPGGSPVQAGYVYDEIVRLRKQNPDKKIYAVVNDVCLSGGYYIASAADEIYVDKASLVGSIGVLLNGFGFVDTLKKLGVERRLLTAGKHKGILDPFSAINLEDQKFVQKTLEVVHKQFIKSVEEGRGKRLKGSEEVFSGLFWTGEQAIELGLADGLGSPESVAREQIGEKKLVEYMTHPNWYENFAKRMGMTFTQTLESSWKNLF
ncbi:MAG: S49 family peptidase [Gammaproteobacteria bacterium]|nr:S49 family peptidase [Gammaproteobacteria bacterium]